MARYKKNDFKPEHKSDDNDAVSQATQTEKEAVAAAQVVQDAQFAVDNTRAQEREAETLTERISRLKSELEDLTTQYNVKFKAVQFTTIELNDKQKELQNIRQLVEKRFQEDANALKRETQAMSKNRSEYEQVLAEVKAEKADLESKKQALNAELAKITEERAHIQAREATVQSKLDSMSADYENQKRKLEKIKTESDEALEKLNTRQEEIKVQRSEVERERKQLDEYHLSKREELETLKVRMEKSIAEAERKQNQAEEARIRLERELKAMKEKEDTIKLRTLELDAREKKVNELIKKNKLEQELSNG